MAIKRYENLRGYGQLELNRADFDANRIEAMSELDPTDFQDLKCENGMLLAIDKANGVLKLPVEDEKLPIGLNYSSETYRPLENYHNFDGVVGRRASHYIDLDGDFIPRLGIPETGAVWTTNCLAYDDEEFVGGDAAFEEAVADAFKDGTTLYGTYCENGATKVTKTYPEGNSLVLQVVRVYTMADGQFALKFHVIKGA